MFGKLALLILACTAAACEPELKVGTWPCTSSSGPAGTMPDGSVVPIKDPVPIPWQNGFEDGFCGYANAKGYCYKRPDAAYTLSDAPVHSGLHSARFSVTGDASLDGGQTRCVREGTMPVDAVYGAWFFLTSTATMGGNWNLMYFNAGNADGLNGLPHGGAEWDVSIGDENGNGPRTLHIFSHFNNKPISDGGAADAGAADAGAADAGAADAGADAGSDDAGAPQKPAVRAGEWFHVEFRFLRTQDSTGRVALYQNGELIEETKDIQTELTGATWGQWYVGNLVSTSVTPPDSTLYVDDVSIAPPPP